MHPVVLICIFFRLSLPAAGGETEKKNRMMSQRRKKHIWRVREDQRREPHCCTFSQITTDGRGGTC